MTVSLPLVVVLGFFAWGAVKFLGVRTWIVVLIALFGFWLSHTFLAPAIESGGRKAGYGPGKVQVRRETKNTKSRAGRRALSLPGPLVSPCSVHTARRKSPSARRPTTCGPSRTTCHQAARWPAEPEHGRSRLEAAAGRRRVRNGRLHDARHTAATVLMLLGVPARVIDQIMGWEPGTYASMRARYLHVPDAEAIWGTPDTPAVDKNQDNEV